MLSTMQRPSSARDKGKRVQRRRSASESQVAALKKEMAASAKVNMHSHLNRHEFIKNEFLYTTDHKRRVVLDLEPEGRVGRPRVKSYVEGLMTLDTLTHPPVPPLVQDVQDASTLANNKNTANLNGALHTDKPTVDVSALPDTLLVKPTPRLQTMDKEHAVSTSTSELKSHIAVHFADRERMHKSLVATAQLGHMLTDAELSETEKVIILFARIVNHV